jgi:hypothetical protein
MAYPDLTLLEDGLSFRQGESVWAPTMCTPPPSRQAPPTAKATSVEAARVKK